MLEKLKKILIDNQLYREAATKDLAHSCCSSNKVVIDFDYVKDEFCRKAKESPKSADALILEESKVVFIEMKDLTSLLEELKKIENKAALEEKLLHLFSHEFRADRKLIDSFGLLLDIAAKYDIDKQFYPFFISDACDKQFLFVLKIPARDYVRLGLAIQAIKYRFNYWIFGDVKFIRANQLDDFV